MSTAGATMVFQLAEALELGDGVTSIVRRASGVLRSLGEPPGILARRQWVPDSLANEIRPCRDVLSARVPGLVFHYWGQNASTWALYAVPGPKAIYYHNITPPRFFVPGSPHHRLTAGGYAQLAEIANHFDFVIGDSQFNVAAFGEHLGRPRPSLHIYPVVEPEEERTAPVDDALLERLRSEPGTKLLFIGRVARNKRQDDLLRAFDAYRSRFDPQAQLWLVGNDECDPAYRDELEALRRALPSGEAVTFTGKLPDAALRAHLLAGDVLVCASEHEGFCIPVAQAMALDIPVVALAAAAVPETLGGGGLLVPTWEPARVAGLIHRVRTDDALRAGVLARQRAAVTRFSAAEAHQRLAAAVRWLRTGAWSPLFAWLRPPHWHHEEAEHGVA